MSLEIENNIPLVSICCLTYNHEPYIKQALDSFLMQQTNFAFEIVIHDDASTDNTAKIIEEYTQKYPEIFKPLLQTENQRSKFGGGMNPRFNYPRARGKYIAICEGDDYWTDPNKLQRQVDFLESNFEYALVAEETEVVDSSENSMGLFSNFFGVSLPNKDITIEELILQRRFATGSVLFRRYENFDFLKCQGDTPTWCYLSTFGKIIRLPNISSVYRRHETGVTATPTVKWYLKMQEWNNFLKKNYPQVSKKIFQERWEKESYGALDKLSVKKNFSFFIKVIFSCFLMSPKKAMNYLYKRFLKK
ncbi:MAG: glycosyltransferase [Flavobacterium sp.]|nr:glycosyltransferase [Flavobacterium sp.]